MNKIASPQDLQGKLREILVYATTSQPSRAVLASQLRRLAEGLEKRAAGESELIKAFKPLLPSVQKFLLERLLDWAPNDEAKAMAAVEVNLERDEISLNMTYYAEDGKDAWDRARFFFGPDSDSWKAGPPRYQAQKLIRLK
jgi:hypothetical protein